MDRIARAAHRILCSISTLAAIAFLVTLSAAGPAWALTVFDFALFSGGGDTLSGGPDTRIGTGATVNGNVGSNEDVDLSGAAIVTGNIYAGRNFTAGNNVVIGSALNPVKVVANGDGDLNGDIFGDFHTGSSSASPVTMLLRANADINGSVFTQNNLKFNVMNGTSVITGNATVGGVIVDQGTNTILGTPTTGSTTGLLSFSPLALPTATGPVPFGATDQLCNTAGCTAISVPAGAWQDLKVGNGKQLTLTSGTYYFRSIDVNGGTSIFLDLSSGAPLNIFVEGNVDFGINHLIFVKGPGDLVYTEIAARPDKSIASLVYLETRGLFDINAGSHWVGTVYASLAEVGADEIHIGSNTEVWGALYAFDSLEILGGSIVNFVRSYLAPPVPAPGALALLASGLLSLGVLAVRRRIAAKA